MVAPEPLLSLLPLRDGEVPRACDCGRIGICSPLGRRSTFRRLRSPHHGRVVYRAACRECEERDPEAADYADIDAGLRALDAGELEMLPGENHVGATRQFPLAPFVEWLEGLMEVERIALGRTPEQPRPLGNVADHIGISARRLAVYLDGERSSVPESTVDRCTTYEGSIGTENLYPYGQATPVYWHPPEPEPADVPAAEACASRGCREPAAEGKWCAEHGAVLGRVAAELEAEAAAVRDRIGREGSTPTCCVSGCWEPRYGTSRFCDGCEAAGYSEEDYE